jgi:AP-3 complex subunit beta
VLKYLIQTQPGLLATLTETSPQSPLTIISHLARRVDSVRHPQARASVFWLVGQYSALPSDEGSLDTNVTKWAPDVLRKAVKSFCQEVPVVVPHF